MKKLNRYQRFRKVCKLSKWEADRLNIIKIENYGYGDVLVFPNIKHTYTHIFLSNWYKEFRKKRNIKYKYEHKTKICQTKRIQRGDNIPLCN